MFSSIELSIWFYIPNTSMENAMSSMEISLNIKYWRPYEKIINVDGWRFLWAWLQFWNIWIKGNDAQKLCLVKLHKSDLYACSK